MSRTGFTLTEYGSVSDSVTVNFILYSRWIAVSQSVLAALPVVSPLTYHLALIFVSKSRPRLS